MDFPNESVFVEIIPIERVVLDHLSEPQYRGLKRCPKDQDVTVNAVDTIQQ